MTSGPGAQFPGSNPGAASTSSRSEHDRSLQKMAHYHGLSFDEAMSSLDVFMPAPNNPPGDAEKLDASGIPHTDLFDLFSRASVDQKF